jgi:hypothetical protein
MKKSLLALFLSAASVAGFAQSNAIKGSNNANIAPFKQNQSPVFNSAMALDGDSVMYFDGNTIYGNPEYVDFNVFDLANVDLDGKQPASQIASAFSSNLAFTFFYNPNAIPDTTYWVGAYSWFNPVGQADNWLIMGPVKCPEQGGQLRWQHRMPDNQYRDGYEVYVAGGGLDPSDFTDSDKIFDVNDNAPSTNGDTVWKTRSAFVPIGYAGQDIYIAFHHNANDMFILYLDEIALVAEPAANVSNATSVSMNVFPSVTKDNLFVTLNETSTNATMSIFDITGKQVMNLSNVSNQNTINVTQLTDGMYFLRTTVNGKVRTDKFIVKH